MNTTDLPEPDGIGKHIGHTGYFYKTALTRSTSERAVDRAARIAGINFSTFNVVKFADHPPIRVSLLMYEDFDASPFPALLDSWTVDLLRGHCTHRSYRTSDNPPILHRKELLLSPQDPRRETFASLTEDLERRGLFRQSSSIGFRRQWEKRLEAAGIEIRNHAVVESPSRAKPHQLSATIVQRHRTAMARSFLSAPMQALGRHGFLDQGASVFDYGCGRGDDVGILSRAGIQAKGWDPHFSPGAPLEQSDVVNLGYVLNVIERPNERADTIRKAYHCARRILAVSVLVAGQNQSSTVASFSDGFLTGRGTFQKYFTQEEVRSLVDDAIGKEAIPVAPGIFFVFRDKIAEQCFLQSRSGQRRDIRHLLAIASPRASKPSKNQALLEEHGEVIEAVRNAAIRLGRLPYLDEIEESIRLEVTERFGSVRNAVKLAQQIYDARELTRARQHRINDLTVYFALNLFSRRPRYGQLPPELQRDIKTFFGSYSQANRDSRNLLLSLGNPAVVREAAQVANSQGFGHLYRMHSLQLDTRLVHLLPLPLRVYVGCAEQLYGDIEGANLVKIHLQSSKLTLLRYDNFDLTPVPRLRERIKINLGSQDIDFFDYSDHAPCQLLFMKSRYMAPSQPGYMRQYKFDQKLTSLNMFDFTGFGPPAEDFEKGLGAACLAVEGFDIVSGGQPLS